MKTKLVSAVVGALVLLAAALPVGASHPGPPLEGEERGRVKACLDMVIHTNNAQYQYDPDPAYDAVEKVQDDHIVHAKRSNWDGTVKVTLKLAEQPCVSADYKYELFVYYDEPPSLATTADESTVTGTANGTEFTFGAVAVAEPDAGDSGDGGHNHDFFNREGDETVCVRAVTSQKAADGSWTVADVAPSTGFCSMISADDEGAGGSVSFFG